jgi:hypothetical protein
MKPIILKSLSYKIKSIGQALHAVFDPSKARRKTVWENLNRY